MSLEGEETQSPVLLEPSRRQEEEETPKANDIILGRGRGIWRTPGNIKFKAVVVANLQTYSDAKGRKEKSKVVDRVLQETMAGGARFLKQKNDLVGGDEWVQVSLKEAREKVAHALRDFHSKWMKDKPKFESIYRLEQTSYLKSEGRKTPNKKVEGEPRSSPPKRRISKNLPPPLLSNASFHSSFRSSSAPPSSHLSFQQHTSSSNTGRSSNDQAFNIQHYASAPSLLPPPPPSYNLHSVERRSSDSGVINSIWNMHQHDVLHPGTAPNLHSVERRRSDGGFEYSSLNSHQLDVVPPGTAVTTATTSASTMTPLEKWMEKQLSVDSSAIEGMEKDKDTGSSTDLSSSKILHDSQEGSDNVEQHLLYTNPPDFC